MVLDESFKHIDQIGEIGQGRGELYYPIDFVIKGRFIYIIDRNAKKNMRVQIFDLMGKCLHEFSAEHKSYGFDVNSRGDMFLGQAESGKLISVYNDKGEMINSFGDLHKISDFYGTDFNSMDDEFEVAINRINMHIDNKDNVYISFVGAPYIRKYDREGQLIFEKRILGPEADKIVNLFAKNKTAPIRRGIDNIPIPYITTGITVDSLSDNIIVFFQWDRGWFYISDSNGGKIITLEPVERSMLFHNISIKNSILYLPRLSSLKYNEAYIYDLANIKSKKIIGGQK